MKHFASTESGVRQCRLLAIDRLFLYRRATDTGDVWAADRLAHLSTGCGDVEAAIEALRARADTGDESVADLLVDLLADHADPDDGFAAIGLATLLTDRGDIDGLRARRRRVCHPPAGQGPRHRRAAGAIPRCLPAGQRLRHRWVVGLADADDGFAVISLARLLAERGDVDGLHTRADAGDGWAADKLADLLAERGDLDGLRARVVDVGEKSARHRLADVRLGRDEDAERLRRFGLNPDGSIASGADG